MVARRWMVTGGAGYVGSHVVRALRSSGRQVVVVDDLSTGVASRLPPEVELLHGSVTDANFLTECLQFASPTGVLHVAAKKSPTESVSDPLLYARENVGGVVALLEAVCATRGSRLVFSSSCSVYGTPGSELVDEDAPKVPDSPYGESKLYGEQLLAAAARAYQLGVISLRYFNVVGAAEPDLADTGAYNLVPLAFQALRAGADLGVFGGDYPTADGTCVRDYVDVEDVADAHVRAVEALERRSVLEVYNVGRGEGSSVLEVLDAIRGVTGATLGYEMLPRRPGDPARVVGAVGRIATDLGWRARRDLVDMVTSAWRAEQKRRDW